MRRLGYTRPDEGQARAVSQMAQPMEELRSPLVAPTGPDRDVANLLDGRWLDLP